MAFRIVLILTLLGLHNIHGDGKSFDAAERPRDYEITVDFPVGSLDVKPKHKRNTYDSDSTEYDSHFGTESEKATTQSLREYIRLIERYLPAIKENVEKIQRKFSDYHPDNQGSRTKSHQDESYGFFERRQDEDLDPERGYNKEDDFYQPVNDYDSDSMYNYKEGGDNQTIPPDFHQLPRSEINWQLAKGETIDPMEDPRKYKPTGNNDFTPCVNGNNMSPNGFASPHNFFNTNMKDINRDGMIDFCDKCGKSIQNCDFGSLPVKPLVININSDCLTQPNNRLINRIPFQSRGHCRPFNFMPPSQHTPKCRPSFHLSEMPRYYSRGSI